MPPDGSQSRRRAPCPAAPRSRLAPGAAPGGGRGAAGAVRGAPGSGHSPARGPLRAARTPRHVRPRGRAGTSCPGLGLSRTLRSPPRLSRASPCARAELTAGKTCWGPGSGRRASPWTGAVSPSDSAELREFVSCGFASGMYLPCPGSCKQEPPGCAGKRSLLAFPAGGWN